MEPVHVLLCSFGAAFAIGCILIYLTKMFFFFPLSVCVVMYYAVKYIKSNEDHNGKS